MKWTSPAELRAQIQRLWDRGDLLRDSVTGAVTWPLRLVLKVPGADDLSDQFEAVRAWVRDMADTPYVRIEWRDWHHRVQGTQRLPAIIWMDSLQDSLAWIGKTRQAEQFGSLWRSTGVDQPLLLPWLLKRPLQALEYAERWTRLIAVVGWIQANPHCNVYLRQVDVPGVDSKFIEAHRGLLAEWLDLVLPIEAIDVHATGVSQFTRRYGFRSKPLRVRFRLLDRSLSSLPGCHGLTDITVDSTSFSHLTLPIDRVFITENETNFLAFPEISRSIVIFGSGYGWETLASAAWLHRCDTRYWGDLDTHGFAILSQLRACLPQVRSLLMDRDTLLAHREHWTEEPDPVRHELPGLNVEEAAVYDDLRSDRFRMKLRLEQERIGWRWMLGHLQAD